MLSIQFNGEVKQLPQSMTIEELLKTEGIPIRFCAVELNMDVLPKTEYAFRTVQDGDHIEVVTLVGGG